MREERETCTVVCVYGGTCTVVVPVVLWYSGTVVRWYGGTVVRWYGGTVVEAFSGVGHKLY